MESIGPFKFHINKHKNPMTYQVWIRADVVPPNNQSRDAFYKCGEAWCAITFDKETWRRRGTSFFFQKEEEAESFFIRIQKGFSQNEEKPLLLKRKLILGGQADERNIF